MKRTREEQPSNQYVEAVKSNSSTFCKAVSMLSSSTAEPYKLLEDDIFMTSLLHNMVHTAQRQTAVAWMFCNLFCNKSDLQLHTMRVTLPILTEMIGKPDVPERCKGKLLWILGALANFNSEARDIALDANVLSLIFESVVQSSDVTVDTLNVALWTVSILLSGSEKAKEQIHQHLPELLKLLDNDLCYLVLGNLSVILYNVCYRNPSYVTTFNEHKVITKMLNRMSKKKVMEKAVGLIYMLSVNSYEGIMEVVTSPFFPYFISKTLKNITEPSFAVANLLLREVLKRRPETFSDNHLKAILRSLQRALTEHVNVEVACATLVPVLRFRRMCIDDFIANGGEAMICEVLKKTVSGSEASNSMFILINLGALRPDVFVRLLDMASMISVFMEDESMRVRYAARQLLERVVPSTWNASAEARKHVLKQLIPFTCSTAQCCICSAEDSAEEFVYLPCFHAFHTSCITQWICKKDACPVCVTSVTSEIKNIIKAPYPQ